MTSFQSMLEMQMKQIPLCDLKQITALCGQKLQQKSVSPVPYETLLLSLTESQFTQIDWRELYIKPGVNLLSYCAIINYSNT